MKHLNNYISEALVKNHISLSNNFVDLGLPSGTLWADNPYKDSGSDDVTIIDWNEAKEICYKNNWSVPTPEQFDELKANTERTYSLKSGKMQFISKINGNIIYIYYNPEKIKKLEKLTKAYPTKRYLDYWTTEETHVAYVKAFNMNPNDHKIIETLKDSKFATLWAVINKNGSN